MTNLDNLTLTSSDLDRCKPIRSKGGAAVRAYCPYHESDHQRSLKVDLTTGRFQCFACGAWGYLEEARLTWIEEKRRQRAWRQKGGSPFVKPVQRLCRVEEKKGAFTPPAPEPVRDDLGTLWQNYRQALPGSLGADYLSRRGIPLDIAQEFGVGYAPVGKWPQRDWKWGRLVFPETAPDGRLINLYGRAVGLDSKIPKPLRHDHLAGNKGFFNCAALRDGEGPLFVCEGPFDALSLLASGRHRSCAIFGLNGWRWDWAREVSDLVVAFDADSRGREALRELAREARLRGKGVNLLPPESLGGCKDVNEAWVAGKLLVGDWEPKKHSPAQATVESPANATDRDRTESALGDVAVRKTVDLLGEDIWIVEDESAAATLGEPRGQVYTRDELRLLNQLAKAEHLQEAHAWKKEFGGVLRSVEVLDEEDAQ